MHTSISGAIIPKGILALGRFAAGGSKAVVALVSERTVGRLRGYLSHWCRDERSEDVEDLHFQQ
jgi:hypothetical protein